MNKAKLQQLELTTHIHTCSIKHDGLVTFEKDYIESKSYSKATGEIFGTSIIKSNKYHKRDLTKYSEFLDVFSEIVSEADIDDFKFARVDLTFDNLEKDSYQQFLKLNKFILMLISCVFKSTNNYLTEQLIVPETISISVKSSVMEVENYDKKKESNNRSNVSARLELRKLDVSKRQKVTEPSIVSGYWKETLLSLPKLVPELEENVNSLLSNYYLEHKDDFPKKWISLNAFVSQNSTKIFSRKQLIKLYEKIGVPNPTRTADKFKERYGCDYFDKSDMKIYIDKLISSMELYFNS